MDTLEPPTGSTPEVAPQPQPQRPKQQCAFCSNPSKYTCPRCHTHTCSLACSQSHKTSTGCSGVRDKAAYIPMNKYGWGSMMDDYCFLEDVGRKVGEWGREIVKGGFEMNVRGVGSSGGVGRGMERGRGRGRGRGSYVMRGRDRGGRGRGGKAKREMLKAQLEAREIEVELLPNGMERRKLNQSAWDPKCVLIPFFNQSIIHLFWLQNPDSTSNYSVQVPPAHRSSLCIIYSPTVHPPHTPQQFIHTSFDPCPKTHPRSS